MCYFNDVNSFMDRLKVAEQYDERYLEIDRPQPLSDNRIDALILEVLSGRIDRDFSDSIFQKFKDETTDWFLKSSLNHLTGLDTFARVDICSGCTQFIDDIYMTGALQVLRGDYKYHERLNIAYIKDVGGLIPGLPLIIAMPFPQIGAPHFDMEEILHECKIKKIEVHIDGAWIGCCRDINFDFSNKVIRSVGISLSKGLGLGWNRVALRWNRFDNQDSISIMNDFAMVNKAPVMIGSHFIKNLQPDYLWNTHGERYQRVCNDFGLEPTKAIHLALKDGRPVGVSPLIRFLENNNDNT
jgi:hypothetical protein